MANRHEAVLDLVRLRVPVDDAIAALRRFPWDCERELVRLGPGELSNVLAMFSSGRISAGELERWANAVEGRDDIAFEPREIIELVAELANPALSGPLDTARIQDLAVTAGLRWLVGDSLTRVRRIFYALGETVDRSSGGVELTFASGRFLRCDSGPDGESAAVAFDQWVDPFEGNMTPENVEYVRTHGKLTAVDVSAETPFDRLIGHRVMDIGQMISTTGTRVGLVLNMFGRLVAIYVNADETYVTALSS